MAPDPKAGARVVDPKATKRKLFAAPLCRCCGARAVNTHHLIGRGQGGDDHVDNLIPLCGSGSDGCHGALHGSPYTRAGRRWTAADVRAAIGLGLTSLERAYAVRKLGEAGAAQMLANLYPPLPVVHSERA